MGIIEEANTKSDLLKCGKKESTLEIKY